MKAIPRILSKVYCEPWLITPEKHRAIQQALEAHMEGRRVGLPLDYDEEQDAAPDRKPYEVVQGGIALIKVSGILGKRLSWFESMCGGYDVDQLTESVQAAVQDPAVSQILIDWDSPGGVVTGIPETAGVIATAKKSKPVFSFSEMVCCSAAYWIASQSSAIFVTQSSAIGSVGCYSVYLDKSRMLDEAGVTVNAISAGEYKLTGAPFKPMTEAERKMLQAQADDLHAHFKTAIHSSRPDVPEDVMEGQVFDGNSAVSFDLADSVVSSLPGALALLR